MSGLAGLAACRQKGDSAVEVQSASAALRDMAEKSSADGAPWSLKVS